MEAMARPLRIQYPGAVYHVTSRGDRRENIYESDADRQVFLSTLWDVCERFNWICHAWCLMSNHYHLVIETPEANLSKGMRQLNGVYTQRFNRQHSKVGHLFQGRFKGILVQKDSYLVELLRYVVLNPVRAKMVVDVSDWPWSSYHVMVGKSTSPRCMNRAWLLSNFGKRSETAIDAYRRFVAEGVAQSSPWHELKNQVFLGHDDFVASALAQSKASDLSEVPSTQRRHMPLGLAEYAKIADNRNDAIHRAYASGGFTMKEIGSFFGLHYSTVSGIVADQKSKT